MNLQEMIRELKSDGEIVTEVLERWAQKTPQKTLVYYGEEDRHISYAEFNALANSIGHGLRTLGIGQGDRVSLFLFNPLVAILAMVGIWKIGAWYCPINFNYKGRLLSYQINDTNPKLLLTESSLVPLVNEVRDELPALPLILHQPAPGDHDHRADATAPDRKFSVTAFGDLLRGPRDNVGLALRARDAANIVYTSGTTGPAKGVVHPYRYMNQYTFNYRKLMTPEDVIYNDLPMYHVGGAFFNFNRAVWAGCTMALWDKFSPTLFWQRIRDCGASHCILLDVMVPWLMNAPAGPQDRLNGLNKVHMQPLPNYFRDVARRFGFDIVTCGFGQTESGNPLLGLLEGVAEGEGTPPELYKGHARVELRAVAERYGYPYIPVGQRIPERYMGRPTPFHEVAVLDDEDEECPPGVLGHLCFRPKLPHMYMHEYFNKPEATRKVFANQWFHTGDGAIRNADGSFCFVDRIGGFIRSRGENISSYQVEDILNSHEAIMASAVFPVPAREGEEEDVVAYIIRQPGNALDEAALRGWISGRMPKFMWPRHIRFVDDFPRTPTNKVEKYKLKQELMAELGIAPRT
ncbi:MAG: AMP-binding protein [Candidatus Lambdaproteobacteria bacterium]|nr:AMP-binding protein [Candidatus Lambdaproteobacteria bacterium]